MARSRRYGNDTLDVLNKGCLDLYDNVACGRISILVVLSIFTFFLILLKIIKYHSYKHSQMHHYAIFYVSAIQSLVWYVIIIIKILRTRIWKTLKMIKMVQMKIPLDLQCGEFPFRSPLPTVGFHHEFLQTISIYTNLSSSMVHVSQISTQRWHCTTRC